MRNPDWPVLDPNDYEDVDIDDDDNPEWTEADFANARPLKELDPELWARLTGATRAVTLDVTPKVIDFFEAQGPDWRTRMSEALAELATDGVKRSA